MSDLYLFLVLGYLAFILFVLVTVLLNLGRGEKECRNSLATILLIIAEVIFTIVGPILGFMRYDEYGPDIPFSKQHVFTIIFLVITSSLSFWLARFSQNTQSPMLRILLSVGMLQGIILCFFISIHFITFIPLGIIWPFAGFELLSPVMALILLSRELYFYNKVKFELDELLPYRKELGFTPFSYQLLELPFLKRIMLYLALLIPFVGIQISLAFGAGQDLDSLVKAFTHSVGFIFSNPN